MMIEKNVKIHDKFQFEVKLGYTIKKNQPETSYDIDTYFFIPNSLDINRHTYTKSIFYKDIQSYIRLKTPTLLLRQIADPESVSFSRLRHSIDNLLEKRDKPARKDFEYHVKMVCSIVKSALRDHVEFSGKSLNVDLPHLVDEFVSQSRALVKRYRDLKPLLNVPTTTEKTLAIFQFGDEFLSQNIELHGFRLLKQLKQSGVGDTGSLKEQLTELVKSESAYRVSCNYHEAPNEANDLGNEALIYRRGVLKKYIGSVLFLDTHKEAEGRFLEQLIIGIAAGLSMVFATLVAFFAQIKFGNFTLPLFTFLVLGYIFKDRIKELSRTYFIKKLNKTRFDHKTNIYNDDRKIGVCKEAVSFISESQLPEKIKRLRKKDHMTEIDNQWRDEKIIFYRKQVNLFSKSLKSVHKDFNIEGINDILRFNVNRFLTKMDNPSRKIYTLKDDDIHILSGDRVYHFNVIIKIAMEKKTVYQQVRIILSRNGIKRIDQHAAGPYK
jgi:hypothetical protein